MKIHRLQRGGKMESTIFVENVIFPFLFPFERRPVECLPGHALMVRCTGAHTQILITLSFFSSSVFCNIWRFYWSITFWTVLLLPLCVVGHVVEIYLFDPFTKSFIFQHKISNCRIITLKKYSDDSYFRKHFADCTDIIDLIEIHQHSILSQKINYPAASWIDKQKQNSKYVALSANHC